MITSGIGFDRSMADSFRHRSFFSCKDYTLNVKDKTNGVLKHLWHVKNTRVCFIRIGRADGVYLTFLLNRRATIRSQGKR